MSLKFYTRKNTGETKISFRYRRGRNNDTVLATPFTIDANYWDQKNECFSESLKKRNPKNEIEKLVNKNIDEFNLKLMN